MQEQGRLLVAKGEVAEGLALLEDAAVAAVSGALGPLATGVIFCNAIDVCRRLADYGRASVYGTPALEAAAQCMRGQVQVAAGDEVGALRSLRAGCRRWQELDAPYETARARMALAAVYRAAGDPETAALERAASRSTFERLGAVLDLARAVEMQASAAPTPAADPELPRAETRTFMFTDVVRSTQLIEAIGDEAWADLVRWRDQTLRTLFATHGGEEVDHAGAGFFVAFAAARPAIECGVAIQRTLLDHRRRQGFAPQVRIRLHAAPAQRHDGAYRGKGVHVAARISALAEAGEILTSRDTVESAPPGITLSAPRPVTLKGVSEPLEVVTLGWR